MSIDTMTIPDQATSQETQREEEAGDQPSEAEAFDTPEHAMGVESGDDLADEIEALLNESAPQPSQSEPQDQSQPASRSTDSNSVKQPDQPTPDTASQSIQSESPSPVAADPDQAQPSDRTDDADSAGTGGFQADPSRENDANAPANVQTSNNAPPAEEQVNVGDNEAVEPDSAIAQQGADRPSHDDPESNHADDTGTQGDVGCTPDQNVTSDQDQPHAEDNSQGQFPQPSPAQPQTPTSAVYRLERTLRRACVMVNMPLASFSAETRAILGYVALATFLNAAAVLAYALLW